MRFIFNILTLYSGKLYLIGNLHEIFQTKRRNLVSGWCQSHITGVGAILWPSCLMDVRRSIDATVFIARSTNE